MTLRIQSALIYCVSQEITDGIIVYIVQDHSITRHILPVHPHLLQEKLMKSSAAKFLLSGSATVVIDSTIGYRHHRRFNDNLNHILAINGEMISFREYTGIVDNLVGQILHLLMKVVNTDNCQIVIDANINLAAMGIGKARYPLQILILPDSLVLYVLILPIHMAKLKKNQYPATNRQHHSLITLK